ncbi:MAG: DUF5689 domain-containing protein [Bacteroidia bacterium]|nr:DUF5689 domain-containing protein [Bacteroidia bacterium]
MKNITLALLVVAISAMILTDCKKKYDLPPLQQAPDGSKINIATLKSKFVPTKPIKFTQDSNLYCVVIADETSGNLYKDVYVRDNSGALHVKLTETGGLYVGDSIRINLKGVILNHYNNLIQLDSVDLTRNVVKLASGLNPQPIEMTIDQIKANTAPTNTVQSQLVRIVGVEFVPASKGVKFADDINKSAKNHTITTCILNKTLLVRTSGYASFAAALTPTGIGSIMGIVSQYQNDMQLIIRNLSEVAMNGTNCSIPQPTFALGSTVNSINENFSSQTATNNPINLTGWINFDENGTRKWTSDVFSGNYRAKVTSFGSSDASNKIWLITPPIQSVPSPTMEFKSAMAYASSGHPNPLTVYISNTFNGSNLLTPGTWTPITNATIAPLTGSNFNFVNSGVVNLSSYLPPSYTGTYCIAFLYYGSASQGYTTNYYLDDIKIQ